MGGYLLSSSRKRNGSSWDGGQTTNSKKLHAEGTKWDGCMRHRPRDPRYACMWYGLTWCGKARVRQRVQYCMYIHTESSTVLYVCTLYMLIGCMADRNCWTLESSLASLPTPSSPSLKPDHISEIRSHGSFNLKISHQEINQPTKITSFLCTQAGSLLEFHQITRSGQELSAYQIAPDLISPKAITLGSTGSFLNHTM